MAGTTRKGDVIGVLEAAYALDLSDDLWLDGVLHSMRPLLDDGLGVLAYRYDASTEGAVRVWSPRYAGGSQDRAERTFEGLAGGIAALTPYQARAAFCESGPVKTLSDIFGRQPDLTPNIGNHISATGAQDFLVVMTQDPSRAGCVLAAARAAASHAAPVEVHRWSRVAAHIAAGDRLRRGATSGVDEAVLTPEGRVVQAAGSARAKSAREALRSAAKRIDRARSSRTRADPEEALALWQGLIAGRWSLLDRFDSDGRRYIIARENDPRIPDPRALSLRERQVLAYTVLGHPLKLAAYELGLSVSSVSRHRANGFRKLRLQSLADAVAFFAAAFSDNAASRASSKKQHG
jgi:DNA-binding CsgD family transcriptional regulator